MTAQILHNIPDAEYHSAEAVSHSRLETFRQRAARYHGQYIAKTILREDSAAFRFGRAFHTLILEPEKFSAKFARRPDGIDRRTTAGKAAYAAFELEHGGKAILDGDDHDNLFEMFGGLGRNEAAVELLKRGIPEVTFRSRVASLPIPVQCRTDWYNAEGCALSGGRPYVVDVKTVDSLDDGEFRNFTKAFYKYGYHRQCGFYLPVIQDCGATVQDWFFVVAEKKAPYGCIVYKPSERAVRIGQEETIADLTALAKCYSENVWPNMAQGVHEIDLPANYEKFYD